VREAIAQAQVTRARAHELLSQSHALWSAAGGAPLDPRR
jgi:hypothetical protein